MKHSPSTRRHFLHTAAAATAGLALPHLSCSQPPPPETGPNILGPRPGYAPMIGTLVSMLDWMRAVIYSSAQDLTTEQLDYLHDPQANSIGAMLLHLAATEKYYQLHTLEGRKWDSWGSAVKRQWDVAMHLGPAARQAIRGHSLNFYLSTLQEVRATTLRQLQQRDDIWLLSVDPDWFWGPTNNYCKWFHVCEHESNHNGQIKWIKSRLPGAQSQD